MLMNLTPEHKRLGHINFKTLRYMITNSNVQDLKIDNKIGAKKVIFFEGYYISQTDWIIFSK